MICEYYPAAQEWLLKLKHHHISQHPTIYLITGTKAFHASSQSQRLTLIECMGTLPTTSPTPKARNKILESNQDTKMWKTNFQHSQDVKSYIRPSHPRPGGQRAALRVQEPCLRYRACRVLWVPFRLQFCLLEKTTRDMERDLGWIGE
jgi:hypothetical protein